MKPCDVSVLMIRWTFSPDSRAGSQIQGSLLFKSVNVQHINPDTASIYIAGVGWHPAKNTWDILRIATPRF